MTMRTKREIFKEKLAEYLKATKEEKGRILNAVCQITKAHRKTVIRRFKILQLRPASWQRKRSGKIKYGLAVTAALKEIWETANQICAERLRPMIFEYVQILTRDKMWDYGEEETDLLLTMSLGTLKNRLAHFEHIKRGGGRGTTKPSELKEIIPVRRGPWQNPAPGFGEVDTVAHCGGSLFGDFVYTVQYTDVATIWTCLAAQWNKGELKTQQSIARIKEHLPFPLQGIDPDSGSEFINWHLKGWCDEQKITMTRTRPYMKNDHARIEQKNYTNVRHMVGYSRLADPAQVKILNEFYNVLEDYINFFLPSVKCIGKERIRSKTVRLYDQPQTAYRRVLASQKISQEVKERLKEKYAKLNPKILKQKCDQILRKLSKSDRRLR